MMEVVVTTGAVRHAKLQSNHHQQNEHPAFFRPDALPVTQPTLSVTGFRKSKSVHIVNSVGSSFAGGSIRRLL